MAVSKPRQNRNRYGLGYRESLSEAMPTRTYRSPKLAVRPTMLTQAVRVVAIILAGLLGVRFVIDLFGQHLGTLNETTNWLVWPLRLVFNSESLSTLVALGAVILASYLLIRVFKRETDELR